MTFAVRQPMEIQFQLTTKTFLSLKSWMLMVDGRIVLPSRHICMGQQESELDLNRQLSEL